MENTVENKAKFFVQYWEQEVLRTSKTELNKVSARWNLKHPDFYLELKPLSAISDDDAIEISKIVGQNEEDFTDGKLSQIRIGKSYRDKLSSGISTNPNTIINIVDFLRSKGYALPYMNLTVEQQIEYGWIKLTNQ